MAPSWARYDIWNVAVSALDAPLHDVRQLAAAAPARWMRRQPAFEFLADPFPYRDGGREWLLAEHGGHRRDVRGTIVRLDPDDPERPAEPAIARDRHISYPYTFADADDVYCAPEMSQEGGCVVYRLERGAWRPAHRILPDVRVVDPTFVRAGGLWWLFCTPAPPRHNSDLRAFFAESLGGPWRPHARDPLKRDLASSRPAGRPFRIGDRLFRPAQDCSRTYGGAVVVMEIDRLTPTAFAETLALRLDPDPRWPFPDGRHHLVVDGSRVYFDAKRIHVDPLLCVKL